MPIFQSASLHCTFYSTKNIRAFFFYLPAYIFSHPLCRSFRLKNVCDIIIFLLPFLQTLLLSSGCKRLEDVRRTELLFDTTDIIIGELGRRMPNLTQLKLNGCHIPRIRDLGTSLSNITVLWMNSVSLTTLSGVVFPALQELYVAFNYIQDVSPLASLEKLCLVDLEGNRVSSADDLQFLVGCNELTSLTLEGNPLADMEDYRGNVKACVPQLLYLDDEEFEAEPASPPMTPQSVPNMQPITLDEWPICESENASKLDSIINTIREEIKQKETVEKEGQTEVLLRERERSLVQESIRRTGHAAKMTEGGGGGGGSSRPASAGWGHSLRLAQQPRATTTSTLLHRTANALHDCPPPTMASLCHNLAHDTPIGESSSSLSTHSNGESLCGNPIKSLRARQYKEGSKRGDDLAPRVLTHASSTLARELEARADETVLESVMASKIGAFSSNTSCVGSGSSGVESGVCSRGEDVEATLNVADFKSCESLVLDSAQCSEIFL